VHCTAMSSSQKCERYFGLTRVFEGGERFDIAFHICGKSNDTATHVLLRWPGWRSWDREHQLGPHRLGERCDRTGVDGLAPVLRGLSLEKLLRRLRQVHYWGESSASGRGVLVRGGVGQSFCLAVITNWTAKLAPDPPPNARNCGAPPKFFASAACTSTKTSQTDEQIGAFSGRISVAHQTSKSFLPNGFSAMDDREHDLVTSIAERCRIFFLKRGVWGSFHTKKVTVRTSF
jgi:hypothetical protein